MKKCFAMVVSALWVTGSVSMAQITNPIPYADTYENYSAGSNLVGTVWQGDISNARAVVTGLVYTPPSVGYSVTNPPTHAQVMAFSDGPITNEFDGTSLTAVAIDTMIKPMFAETPSGSQMGAVSNSQMSLFVDTNGFLNIFHAKYAEFDEPGSQYNWGWSILSNGVTKLDTNDWIRLTITMNYNPTLVMYKVALNGTTISGAEGFISTTVATNKNGSWFAAPANNAGMLQRIVLSGSGLLDDMVVTTNAITYGSQGLGNATNGVPIQWMLDRGMVTNSTYPTYDQLALGDWDNDGAPTWTERLAGTDPTNEFSKLVIISSTIVNGLPVLKWIGTTNAMNTYNIQWSSNLTIISGWTTPTGGLPKGNSSFSTNEVTLPSAPNFTPVFMRVTVTN
jgi:hypothetical protein